MGKAWTDTSAHSPLFSEEQWHFFTVISQFSRLKKEKRFQKVQEARDQVLTANDVTSTCIIPSSKLPLTSTFDLNLAMAANDLRGWVMSAVSGVGKLGNEPFLPSIPTDSISQPASSGRPSSASTC